MGNNLVNGQRMPEELSEFQDESDKLAQGEILPTPEKKEETPAPEGTKEIKPEGEELSEEEKAQSEADKIAEEEAKSKTDKGNLKTIEDKNNPPSMSLSKYKIKKKNWEEQTAKQLADLEEKHKVEMEDLKKSISSTTATNKSVEEDIKKFAEETGIEDVDVVNKLIGVITKNLPGLDPQIKKDIDAFKEAQKKNAEELGFETDFSKTAEPYLRKLNPNLDEAHLKEAKEKLKELAYKEEYMKLPLDKVIKLEEEKFKYNLDKKKTVETSRPGSQTGAVNDYANWTSEDIEKASPEEFEKYSNFMASQSSSRIRVSDANGNEVK